MSKTDSSANDCVRNLTFFYHEVQRSRFVSGQLGKKWAKKYPDVFDEDDKRLYKNQCEMGYHFYEWLAAIMIYESTGYISLIQKYGAKSHPRKLKLWEKYASDRVQAIECEAGWPDIFAFSPKTGDFFFCETKGRDKLLPSQRACFSEICKATDRQVQVIRFEETSHF